RHGAAAHHRPPASASAVQRPGVRRTVVDPRGQPAHAHHDRGAGRGGLQDLPRLREGAGMNAAPTYTALVLAGTRPGGDPLADYAGVSHKALIEVGGVPMLLRVLRA